MDIQSILVTLLFVAAIFYIGRMIFRAASPKSSGCATGCGKCGVDLSNIKPDKK